MHGSLIPAEQVDDFIILRARAFTSRVRHAVTHDVLGNEDLALLEWQLLFSIARFGSCHVGHITRHTSIDPAHGSRAAAALEAKGLITRIEDPGNKRRKLISLTQEGMAVFERIWPQARQVTMDHTNRLSATELGELKRLLDLLNGVAQGDVAPAPEDNGETDPSAQTGKEIAVSS